MSGRGCYAAALLGVALLLPRSAAAQASGAGLLPLPDSADSGEPYLYSAYQYRGGGRHAGTARVDVGGARWGAGAGVGYAGGGSGAGLELSGVLMHRLVPWGNTWDEKGVQVQAGVTGNRGNGEWRVDVPASAAVVLDVNPGDLFAVVWLSADGVLRDATDTGQVHGGASAGARVSRLVFGLAAGLHAHGGWRGDRDGYGEVGVHVRLAP